jgi:hypothetical protein
VVRPVEELRSSRSGSNGFAEFILSGVEGLAMTTEAVFDFLRGRDYSYQAKNAGFRLPIPSVEILVDI